MADKTLTLNNGACRVFVYGSLKKDHSNHGLLDEYRMVCRDSITGPYRMYSLGYFPGVVDVGADEGLATIYGEVYEVDEEGLGALDLLEGHPSFYCRERMKTDEGIRVWMYVLQGWNKRASEEVDGMWLPTDEELEYWSGEAKDAEGAA